MKFQGWKSGSPMPEARIAGCMLAINECEVAFIGGLETATNTASNSIFIYNCETEEWRTYTKTLSI